MIRAVLRQGSIVFMSSWLLPPELFYVECVATKLYPTGLKPYRQKPVSDLVVITVTEKIVSQAKVPSAMY